MEREEHLKFCKVCENRSFNPQKGIVCKLTGEMADFELECDNFLGDRNQVVSSGEVEVDNSSKSKLSDFLSLFIPANGYFITPIIVDICLLLFLVMALFGVHIIEPNTDSLISWGANFKPLTLGGQYWRLISNVFIHIGILHLVVNMYALLYIGLLLEPFIGRKNFIVSYIVTGLAASVASLWWYDSVISAGASGAIFGLYGVYIALITTNLLEKEFKMKALSSMLFFVAYNLLYGLKGGVDNAAHIGGLISGLVLGYSLYPSIAKPELKVKNSIINYAVIALVLGLVSFTVITTPNFYGKYENLMKSFVKYEEKAMGFYRLPQTSSRSQLLKSIREDGIPNWKNCNEVVMQAEEIEGLPDKLKATIPLLRKYCDFRIKSFELMAGALESGTNNSYLINSYNQKIDLIIRKLQGEQVNDSLLVEPQKPAITNGFPAGALYVVDGKPVDSIDDLFPENIASISILDPESAMSIYGERGRKGAVLIQLNLNSQFVKPIKP